MMTVAVWATVFLLFGPCHGILTITERLRAWIGYSLDMAPNSVDDMYDGCADQMQHEVNTELLMDEKCKSNTFNLAWKKAEKYYNREWKNRPGTVLNKEEIMAVHAYTLIDPPLYIEFNKAVRTQKLKYKTTFAYHTMHFFLTTAIQILNFNKPETEKCVTGYRRVDRTFRNIFLFKRIRFGAFTSSSAGFYLSSKSGFGDKSCFEIYTCLAADISEYSDFEGEREVLIPPYEIFKIIQIEERSKNKDLPCEVVYKLNSTRESLSNLNCTFLSPGPALSIDHSGHCPGRHLLEGVPNPNYYYY